MAYITRCPTCGCAYRISAEELQEDGGHCRCGICQSRFDAREELREIGEQTLLALTEGTGSDPAAEPPVPAPAASPRRPEPLPAASPSPREPVSPRTAGFAGKPRFAPKLELPLAKSSSGGKSSHGFLWLCGSLVLLLVLAWQILSLFGPALSRHVPGLLAIRQAVCGAIPCPGPGSQSANPFSIDGFELKLQSLDRYEIAFTLENNGTAARKLPLLEVVFTDSKGLIAARRVLKPGEYAGRPPQTEIAAGGSMPVRFTFGLAGERPASCEVKALPGA